MKLKKQNKSEAIQKICYELRGKLSGQNLKQCILYFLLYLFLSEKISNRISEETNSNYCNLPDDKAQKLKEKCINEFGFFLYPSELFCNVLKNVNGKTNLSKTLEKIFKNIENSSIGSPSEKCFRGIFNTLDLNTIELGDTQEKRNKILITLLNILSKINITDNSDLLGDIYEFLIFSYDSNAGKLGGEYFTPQQVSTLLTKLCLLKYDGTYKKSVRKVYDPTCGSGSLLLQSAKILGKDNIDVGFFGQELNYITHNLCKINLFLHDIPYDKIDIECDDTLTNPKHSLDDELFEVIVSNPPYSIKYAGDNNKNLINDPRFSPAGTLAPKSKADFAFIMHSLAYLSPDGKAAIVCFPGIFYRTGAEQKIRQYLVDNNFVDSIIQLSPNLFSNTNVSTCILVLSKSKPDNNVLFIDASNEFIRAKNNNELSDENIENILSIYSTRESKKHISNLVPNVEIEKNSYNLSVSSYVEKKSENKKINISELNEKIKKVVQRNRQLRDEIDSIISSLGGDYYVNT